MINYKFLTCCSIFLLIFSFSFIAFIAKASTVIFSDGFESDFSNWTGNDPKWDISGGNIHGGSKRGEVKGNTEPGDDVLIKNISTSGYDEIVFEFWYRIKESFEDDDHLYVEWTGDGSDGNILNDFTAITKSATWTFASYFLPITADDQSTFAIRFRAHLSAVTSDIFYLDDVVLKGNSGTSTPPSTSSGSSALPTTTPTSSPSPSPSVTSMPTPLADSTRSPQATPTPSSSTSMPTSSPKPSPSPFSTVSMPSNKAPTSTPVVTSSPKPIKQDREQSVNLTPISLEDLTVVSQSPGSNLKGEILTSEMPDNFSVSISNFFYNSKFFWLIATMVLAVVFSLAKFKKD